MVKKKEAPAVEEVKQEAPIDPVMEPEAPEAVAPPKDPVTERAIKELKALEEQALAEKTLAEKPPDRERASRHSKKRAPKTNYKALYEGQVRLNKQASELLTASEGQDLTVRGFIALSAQIKGMLGG